MEEGGDDGGGVGVVAGEGKELEWIGDAAAGDYDEDGVCQMKMLYWE
jgi:hypothetical protein